MDETESLCEGDSADTTQQRAYHLQHKPILLPCTSAFKASRGLEIKKKDPRTEESAKESRRRSRRGEGETEKIQAEKES